MKKLFIFIFMFIILAVSALAFFESDPNIILTYLDTPTMCLPTLCPINAYCHLFNTNKKIVYLNYTSVPNGTILYYEVDG